MGTLRHTTKWIMLCTAGAWIAWDILAVLVGGAESTISAIVIDAAEGYTCIPWGCGALMGHFFGPRSGRSARAKLAGLAALLLQFGALAAMHELTSSVPMLLALAVGVAQGALQWPQGFDSD